MLAAQAQGYEGGQAVCTQCMRATWYVQQPLLPWNKECIIDAVCKIGGKSSPSCFAYQGALAYARKQGPESGRKGHKLKRMPAGCPLGCNIP